MDYDTYEDLQGLWSDLEAALALVLTHPGQVSDVPQKVLQLDAWLQELMAHDSDAGLYLMYQLAAASTPVGYSASHALVCATLSHLLAQSYRLPTLERNALVHAALTMNIGMTQLQNQLALRQCQNRPFSYLTIQLGLALGNLLWTVLIFQFFAGDTTDKVAQRLMAIILAHGVTFVAALAWAKYQFAINFRFTPKRLKLGLGYILTLGLPLLLHGLSYTIKGQLDRVLIHQRFSSHELGVYSAGVQVASSLTIVIMAVNSALVPHLYERLKSQRMTVMQLHRLFWLSLMVPVMLTAMAWAMPSSLMAWLLGSDFAQSQYYVVMFVLAFSLIIPYLLLVNFLFYHAKSAQISLCSVISTLVYLLALWVLSGVSLAAVPYATIISGVVILPLLYYYTLQVEKDKKTP